MAEYLYVELSVDAEVVSLVGDEALVRARFCVNGKPLSDGDLFWIVSLEDE